IDAKNLTGDGVVTGYGPVNGRTVFAYAQDFTRQGGTVATVHAKKVLRLMRQALKAGAPCVHMIDSGGVRIQDAVTRDYNDAYPAYFYIQSIASGVIPQISLLMGPCAAGAAYSPILNDFLIMVKKTSHMYVASPTLIKAAQFVDVTEEEIGGAYMHATVSGCCDLLAENDEDCLAKAKELLSFLPSNNREDPPVVATGDDPNRRDERLLDIVPTDDKSPYDMHRVIECIIDNGRSLEIKPDFAKNMITAFARFDGRTVGIVANNPQCLAGSIDINAAVKEARFIRFCDCFNIPLIFLVDTPAYLPGVSQERGGIIRHGAKVLHALSEATVPKIAICIRKGYGGGLVAMCNEPLGADLLLAWPTAQMGLMGAEGAVDIIYRKEIASAAEPGEVRRQRLEEYASTFGRFPYHAAAMRWVEDIIDPRDTRRLIIAGLRTYKGKTEDRPWRKHGNIPL
ncbi:MAG: acyl-CoA carboxylase subunit beta, partial [Deltaproteobacteria bacterium]|nr:acyl-CoA carboxylase subunit beta [Deltaproteobacteria bacterium]